MTIATSKLTAQGQISVPARVRRKLGIGPGAIIEWQEQGEHVLVRRAGRITSLDIHRALFARAPARAASLAKLKAGIRRRVAKRHARR